MRVVVDASVVVKWILRDPATEPDTERALLLLREIREDRLQPVQPAHWLAETTAVLCRLRPEAAAPSLDLLDAMELPVLDGPEVYRAAIDLATRLDHHLFDTLYHAVALRGDATLLTADDAYHRKAREEGGLRLLADWTP